MDSRWFKNGVDKEAQRKELLSYRRAFEALRELLEEEFEEVPSDYDISNWACKAADKNGANRKLRSILKLITVKE
jgi:hypothetical protein